VRIALISTVKNEEETILQHLEYHRFLGVTDFYIFLDHSSDGTKDKIATLPSITIYENLAYEDLLPFNRDKPELDLEQIQGFFATHLGMRQIFNANLALAMCRQAGIDWLIQLDQDELVCLDKTRVEESALEVFLSSLEEDVGAVSFRNVEVVPTKVETTSVFEGRLFKNQDADASDPGWPKSQIYNPFTKSRAQAGWFWGHSSGKLALRPGRNAYFISSHQCHTSGRIINAEYLLHYNIANFKQFLNKYRNFAHYPKRPRARPLRMLLIEVVNRGGFSDGFLLDYFREHILYTKEDIERIHRLDEHAILEITAVSDFFSQRNC
jgi:hypothetical protein